jgi:hypothetical protein
VSFIALALKGGIDVPAKPVLGEEAFNTKRK